MAEFRSFAVLDMETTNLARSHFDNVSIMEICMYGFSAEELFNNQLWQGELSPLPRVLHKFTLMLKPRYRVHRFAAKITRLNNFMLKNESRFNRNAGETIIGFVQHLAQPVCLVAHNGDRFDFPILKYALSKFDLAFPEDTVCVDSLLAFSEFRKQGYNFPSLGLANLYDYTFGGPIPNHHQAEGDVQALMDLMLYHGEEFHNYACQCAMPFINIQ